MFIFNKISNVVYSVYHEWNSKYIGEIYMEVNGFFVYEPAKGSSGYWSEEGMLEIGNKLKELNTFWKEQIKKDLEDIE